MNTSGKARIAILISGRGSNLQAFIDACESGDLDASIALVLSNNPDAAGLARAAAAGIPTACVNHREFPSREAFDAALVAKLQPVEPDLVILAGFMRILTPVFITPFTGKLLNIHPSLLPKYPGLDTHRRALAAGDSEAGVTVHFVTPELDGGPPVIQARVPINPGDTPEALAARVIVQEHVIYPIAAKWQLQHRLQLDEQGATLDGKRIPASGIDYVPGID
ncbi:phosphoribosylglycinamide formyltransferase [Seongchinamella sediminis]|uniref:Phosphoribosylglycinamide formyltransferase n=1 Tax=Seongchinamella sediminis TaxID=2283635 RepID=A0A3L7DZX2_9GAMM|nr:phosphoribosylglycinamide formyltransferase [Seongchinamella sediminis]RLQ21683.1 phosphoribosylglycinamide formyltransferase [Seongchinamella sediminis]